MSKLTGSAASPEVKEFAHRSARAYDVAEADLLREFYKRWEILHGIGADQIHRKQKEQAAQTLVEQAHILRRFYAN